MPFRIDGGLILGMYSRSMGQAVDPCHPLRWIRRCTGRRALAPGTDCEEEQEYAQDDLAHCERLFRCIVGRGAALEASQYDTPMTTANAALHPSMNNGPFTLARRENSMRMTAMIGTGLTATPTA